MTSQTILAKPDTTEQAVPTRSMDSNEARLLDTIQHVYTSDHQAKYLDLKAQVESLLQQLQAETKS